MRVYSHSYWLVVFVKPIASDRNLDLTVDLAEIPLTDLDLGEARDRLDGAEVAEVGQAALEDVALLRPS